MLFFFYVIFVRIIFVRIIFVKKFDLYWQIEKRGI